MWAIVWTELWKLLIPLGIAQLGVVPEVYRYPQSLTGDNSAPQVCIPSLYTAVYFNIS